MTSPAALLATLGPTRPARARALRVATWLMFGCGMLLALDVGGELHVALLHPQTLTLVAVLHLAGEVAATLGLGWAFALVRAELRRTRADAADDRARLGALRGAFDGLMHDRFESWGLSMAERDVALLTVRGLRISDIAAARAVREGTVKSQLSTIFRKSGVHTRTEFVALFIDEFLDHAARDGAGDADRPAQPQRPAPVIARADHGAPVA